MINKKIDLSNVPNSPGCYLWKDISGEVIYVGKAKDLKKRMNQYFSNNVSLKTNLLVKNIDSFEYIVVPTEQDSLLTELSLIKKYNPKYNIKLKQTNSYPYIKLSMHPLQVEIIREIKNEKNTRTIKYFGPFPSGYNPFKVKQIIESTFKIGKCLGPNLGKPCLNYQINICPGYCVNNISVDYEKSTFKKVNEFFSGNVDETINMIKDKMNSYSEKMLFEEAKKLYESIKIIESYRENQKVIFDDQKLNLDIIGFYKKDNIVSIYIYFIRSGKLINTDGLVFNDFEIDEKTTLVNFFNRYYSNKYIPDEVVISNNLFEQLDENYLEEIPLLINIKTAKKGKIKSLIDFVSEQARTNYDLENIIVREKKNRVEENIKSLKEISNIKKVNLIEAVDISNIQGNDQVGVVVSFLNFEPNKKGYRKYSIENNHQDDYAAIYEVTYRHFRRKLIDKGEFPEIYFVDGKFQVNAAYKVIEELGLKNKVKILGLVKNRKHSIEYVYDMKLKEISLKDKNDLKLLLGNIQDEVHRFAIKYHKEKRYGKLFPKKN